MKEKSLLKLTATVLFLCASIVLCTPLKADFVNNKGTHSTPEALFETAKRGCTPELIAFLVRMPKGGDLHNHLLGATYGEFLLESASKNNLLFDPASKHFYSAKEAKNLSENQRAKLIPAAELKQPENEKAYYAYRDAISTRGAYITGKIHDHFFDTFLRMLSTNRSYGQMLAEVIHRNHSQNVNYLELILSLIDQQPVEDALKNFSMDNLEQAYQQAEAAYQKYQVAQKTVTTLNEIEVEAHKLLLRKYNEEGFPVTVRYIIETWRNVNNKTFFAMAFCNMKAVNLDPRIVAHNIVQPEDMPLSRQCFSAQMKILDFLWHKMNKPHMTLHAGELVLRDSPVEPMQDRISRTIKEGHAERIGHGVSIAWEKNLPQLLKQMREEGICVEICLSSNEGILGIRGNDHPFNLFRKNAVPVTICTDDEGVNRSNLTMEFVKAVKRYNISYDQLKDIVRNSIEYSFLTGRSLYQKHNYNLLVPEFENVRAPEWMPDKSQAELMRSNQKLNEQIKLEREFVKFETKTCPLLSTIIH
ncbi:hypothetical protein P0136_07830 [Lentisphaerota bacterium ZTH]|nr:hypothetical protein JYG24_01060 [Lentisphaerota bacterium]WET05274.1 hypothetical protein P0136_07830 [Lentisphaerota bacterium ZTH]